MTRHGGPYAFALWSTDSCGQMFVMRTTTLRAIAFLLIRIDYTRKRERENWFEFEIPIFPLIRFFILKLWFKFIEIGKEM